MSETVTSLSAVDAVSTAPSETSNAPTPRAALDPNYVFRGKIHMLAAQNAHYSQQLNCSDAKGATLIALVGVLTVNTPLQVSSIDAPTLFFLGLVGASMLFALWAIMPKVPSPATREQIKAADVFSWPGLAEEEIEAFAERAREADADALVSWIARSNAATSRILLKKFKRLQAAFIFAALSLGPYALILTKSAAP